MKTRYNLGEAVASQRRILFVCEYPHELQEVDLGDIGASDTFTLTYKAQTTGSISQSADMTAAIVTALEALSNVEDGDVVVTKDGGGQVYYVGLGGTLIGAGIGLLSVSPTGFTPGGVTRLGYAGSPATGLTFAAADIQISKNGAADANSAGTVTEIGYGRYYYVATVAEMDTRGVLSLVTVREDIAVSFPTVEIAAGVLRSCVAQSSTTTSVQIDAAASSTSDFYLPCVVTPVAGTGAGQGPRFCTAYNGVTKTFTTTPEWTVLPNDTTEVEVISSIPMASADDVAAAAGDDAQGKIISGATPLNVNASGAGDAVLAPRRSS
jgi:hypothetical protein